MTILVNPGPGVTSWDVIGHVAGQSSVWAVLVNGTPSFVYSYSRTSPIVCDAWPAGATVTKAWTQFNSDEATTLIVTRTGGITSAVVYPTGAASFVVDAGILTIDCPVDVDLIVEVDGDRKDTLCIFADPPRSAIPAGAADWSAVGQKIASAVNPTTNRFTFPTAHGLSANERVSLLTTGTLPTAVGGDLAALTYYYVRVVDSTNIELARTAGGAAIDLTSAGTGTHTVYRTSWGGSPLYFPAGLWDIGLLFYVGANTTIYLDAGAVVRGSIDNRHLSEAPVGMALRGPGLLSAAVATSEYVFSFSDFFDRIIYSAILGFSGGSNGGFWHNTEVSEVTITAFPYYSAFEGVNRWNQVKLIAPWTWSCDGFKFSYRTTSDTSARCENCFAMVADDVLYIDDFFASVVATGNFLTTVQNSLIHSTYWPNPDTSAIQLVEGNDLLHYGIADVDADVPVFPTKGGNAIFKAWTDGFASEEGEGCHDVLLRNNRVHGPLRSRVFSFSNKTYPFGDLGELSRDRRGEVMRWVIDGLVVDQLPGQPSIIEGLDRKNTPHDLAFFGVVIAGTELTAANFSSYVVRNEFPYNIYVNGIPATPYVTSTGAWYAQDPEQAPFSFQPLLSRLNNGRIVDGPQVWFPTGAISPTRGPYRNATAPANWAASEIQLSCLAAGASSFVSSPTARVAVRAVAQGASSFSAGLSVRQGLASFMQASSSLAANPTKVSPSGLAAAMASSSAFQAAPTALVSLAAAMQASSSMSVDMTPPGTVELSCVMQAGSTFSCPVGVTASSTSLLQFDPMKQRIYNTLLAVCNAGPFHEAKVDAKTGQMTVFTSKVIKPVSVDVREITKQYQPASRYRRAFNVAEIASWVFEVELRFASGVRSSCEQFEQSIADAGITVPPAKGIAASRSLLARLADSKYDEPPAQNPSLGSVVLFTFEVVPETLRS